MAMIHGKVGAVLIGTADVSAFANDIGFKTSADAAETTTFGATGKTYAGGLTDGTVTLKGLYDNTAVVGPRPAIQAKLGTSVAVKYRPEGVGTGKPETTCQTVVTAYEESVPVADMITWTAEFQISGAVTTAVQP